jgi:hypothetical protein
MSSEEGPAVGGPASRSRGTHRWRLLIGALLIALALGVVACGSSSSSSTGTSSAGAAGSSTTTTISHTKTKFALHAGLAFGAFHRWIYKPLKAGDFSHPLSHKLTTIKAALAAAFVYHELKLALADAQADPTLSHLVAPITALQDKIRGTGSSLKSGSADTSQIEDLNSSIGSITGQAKSAGQTITEQTPSSP